MPRRSPLGKMKTCLSDIQKGINFGIIQLPPLTRCARAVVRDFQNDLPAAWYPCWGSLILRKDRQQPNIYESLEVTTHAEPKSSV